jgi:hypothetical protein
MRKMRCRYIPACKNKQGSHHGGRQDCRRSFLSFLFRRVIRKAAADQMEKEMTDPGI